MGGRRGYAGLELRRAALLGVQAAPFAVSAFHATESAHSNVCQSGARVSTAGRHYSSNTKMTWQSPSELVSQI